MSGYYLSFPLPPRSPIHFFLASELPRLVGSAAGLSQHCCEACGNFRQALSFPGGSPPNEYTALRWLQAINSPEVSDTAFLVRSSSWQEAHKDGSKHRVTQQINKKTPYRKSTCLFQLSFLPSQGSWGLSQPLAKATAVSQQPWRTHAQPRLLFLFLAGHWVKSSILTPHASERSLLSPGPFFYQSR